MKIEQNYSLQRFNTFHIAVKTRWFREYENETELMQILNDDSFRKLSFLHIGCGSNLLFTNDFHGIVLHSAIKGITLIEESDSDVLVRIGAAEIWDDVVAYTVRKGWGGVENLSLIPGETGAAAVQNIGAYGKEIKDVIENVEAIGTLDCKKRVFSNSDCAYDYRSSIFKNDPTHIITYVTLRLQKYPELHLEYGNLKRIGNANESVTVRQVRDTVIAIRQKKLPDPDEFGNAGSFFLNPVVTPERLAQLIKDYPSIPHYPAKNGYVKLSAGWLVEQCGLKGKRFGSVGVYEHHALIIVNYGAATGSEIAQFARHISDTVHHLFDVQLIPEVKYVP